MTSPYFSLPLLGPMVAICRLSDRKRLAIFMKMTGALGKPCLCLGRCSSERLDQTFLVLDKLHFWDTNRFAYLFEQYCAEWLNQAQSFLNQEFPIWNHPLHGGQM
jgi:hypothetical protein